MSHISSRITAAAIEAQDWTDALDRLGALATADDLQRLLAIAPADIEGAPPVLTAAAAAKVKPRAKAAQRTR